MITGESRYMNGTIYPLVNRKVSLRRGVVNRQRRVMLYTWQESDRLDRVASMFLRNPRFWWQIMDANPSILNPQEIRPGQQIRIPTNV